MPFILAIYVFVYSWQYATASRDPPKQPLTDGSKVAFIRAPYLNTVKLHEEVAVQDDMSVRWSNGVVPYYFDDLSYDHGILENILQAIDLIEKRSCIQFTKLESKYCCNNSWIHITNPTKERECNHEPKFKDSGEIVLVFAYNCLTPKEILHSLLHGIGMKDEVTHPQRDKYIRVLWDNINPEYHHLYRKQILKQSTVLVEYDPLSIMQFHDRAFSRNGRATIVPLEPGLLISPSNTLSQLDQMRLKVYFGHECNKRSVSNILQLCKTSFNQHGDNVDDQQSNNNNEKDHSVSEYSTEYKNYDNSVENSTTISNITNENNSAGSANEKQLAEEFSDESEVIESEDEKDKSEANEIVNAESTNMINEDTKKLVITDKKINTDIEGDSVKKLHMGNSSSDNEVKLLNKIDSIVFYSDRDTNTDEFSYKDEETTASYSETDEIENTIIVD